MSATVFKRPITSAPFRKPEMTGPVPRLMLRQAEQVVLKTAHEFKSKPTDANRDRLFASVTLLETLRR